MKKLLKRIKALEERVEELENNQQAPHGKRMDFYAEWIMSHFKKKNIVLISDIRDAAKKKGYSWQMITKARRELLDLDTEVGNGERGWAWVKQ